jgi:NADPH-dependent 2,4-dienoyl-CoA reductase/sulfur reductase-like enzyme
VHLLTVQPGAQLVRGDEVVALGPHRSLGPDRDVPARFTVGLRLAVTDELPDGLTTDEGLTAAHSLIAEGVDFLSVIRGHIDTDQGLTRVIPPMGMPSAPHLDFAGQVRRALRIPVMHAARISDVATARHAVRNGLVDLVGMTRAQMADPHLVAKIAAGQEDRIRPCVGAGYCLDAIYQGGDAKCIHNPSTGRESRLPHLVPRPGGSAKHVVVVGAGPAGLECARVLGERGHRVTVLEAADTPGGQLRLASRAIARRDLIGIIDWRVSESARFDVTIHYNVWAEPPDVTRHKPDVVIIATGGVPDISFLDAGNDLVIDAWDVLSGGRTLRGDVLLYDDNGGHAGLDAARAVIESGSGLEYVTPGRIFAPDVGGMNYPLYAKDFTSSDAARITLLHSLQAVRRRSDGRLDAVLHSEYADRYVERVVDAVVVEQGTRPNDELYHALVPDSVNGGEVDLDSLLALKPQAVRRNPDSGYQLFRIGDAVSSRNVHAAVYDAFRLCLAI